MAREVEPVAQIAAVGVVTLIAGVEVNRSAAKLDGQHRATSPSVSALTTTGSSVGVMGPRLCLGSTSWATRAETDGEGTPVGHALLTRCHIGDVPALCLAPCAVLPGFQRTGAGSAAIAAGLEAARAMGESFVVVLGHPTYYPRFGFDWASAHRITLSIEVPDEALMALSLDGTPLPGGQVRYAEPFGI